MISRIDKLDFVAIYQCVKYAVYNIYMLTYLRLHQSFQEARIAIEQVVIPKEEPVELLPRPPQIISLQTELIEKYQLQSEKVGKGSDVCLRILPFKLVKDEDKSSGEDANVNDFENFEPYGANGSPHGVDRLPLLPD